jgi:hypothetical protein
MGCSPGVAAAQHILYNILTKSTGLPFLYFLGKKAFISRYHEKIKVSKQHKMAHTSIITSTFVKSKFFYKPQKNLVEV